MKKNNKIFLIAQNIRSLFNIGALFRCADVFQVDKIYLTGYTAAPKGDIKTSRQKREIAKVALGAEKWIAWEKYRHTHLLIPKLKQQGFKIYALETGKETKNLENFKPSFPCALIVGNEIKGITKTILKLADKIISIPVRGKKDSLNVGVAAGIGLYELNRRRK